MSEQPLSPECGLRLVDLMNAVENGIQPYPLFFHYNNCEGQWPNVQDSDVKARETTFGHSKASDICTSRKIAECAVPFTSAIIAPPNVKIQFYSKYVAPVSNIILDMSVQNFGYYELNSEINLNPDGIVPIPTTLNASTSMWRLTQNFIGKASNPPAYVQDVNSIGHHWNRLPSAISDDCNYPSRASTSQTVISSTYDFCPQGCKSFAGTKYNNPDNKNFDWNNLTTSLNLYNTQLKASLVSCGSVFWPSFTSIESVKNAPLTSTKTNKAKTEWIKPNYYTHVTEQGGSDNLTPGGYMVHSIINKPIDSDDKIWFTTRDCMGAYEYGSDEQAPCDGTEVDGSVGEINITQTQPWFLTQIQACNGTNPLKIANNLVNSYGDGTDLCDPIMERACNSTIIQTDPDLSVSCECIVEKQKLQQQFAGLDLPVECFLDICNKEGRGIYHTKQQKQGCNARICEQIFRVHGYDLIANGQQTMKCSGEVYNVNNFVNQVNTTATVGLPTPQVPKATLHFTPLFYGALGLMCLMGLLLVVWLIRRSILYKRLKSQKKKQIEDILSEDLQKLQRGKKVQNV